MILWICSTAGRENLARIYISDYKGSGYESTL